MLTRRLSNIVLRVLFKLLFRLEVLGLENVPLEGPLILMINHVNFLDPVLAGGVMPREVTPLSKAELFRHPILGIFVRLYGALPVRRGEVDRWALRRSLEILRRGEALLMAPEGTRSHVPGLQRGRNGISYIAVRAGAPILPVAIVGGDKFFPNLKRFRRTPIRIIIGKPFRFSPGEGKVKREKLRKLTEEAMYQLAALLPPEYRGLYSNLDAASTNFLVFE
jgi:1-acyl-sn-glycerol-3-phosphate acyltransferase